MTNYVEYTRLGRKETERREAYRALVPGAC